MWITRQLDGGAAAVNEAGRLRMQAWRLANSVYGGRTEAEITGMIQAFDESLKLLRDGDPLRPLFVPWNQQSQAQYADLEGAWRNLRVMWRAKPLPTTAEVTPAVDQFVTQVDVLVLTVEKTMSRYTAVLNLAQLVMMGLAVLAAVLTLYVGYLFVIHPLNRLRLAFAAVEQGDFSVRVPHESADEFGQLANGFNHMALTLQSMYRDLERKVEEKTRDLQAERQRLAALYEVSNFLVESHNLEELAQGFAKKVRQLSNADAVAVRWSDAASQRYLMLASDCLPDELVREERCVEPGLCACGQPQATARTRVIPIAIESPDNFKACAKIGYQTVISVPIKLQQRVLGEVDLFYREDTTLTEKDRGLYDALAGHLASAVENLRTDALVREAAVGEERALLARELHDSIAQSLAFLKIQISLLRQALHKGDRDQVTGIIDELDTGVQESTHDVRELLVHFRTRTTNEDIEQALRTTLHKFEHQSGVKAHLNIRGNAVPLPSDIQLQVLHVLQEALSNVRKHAGATEVHMVVDKGPSWRFTVRDNGHGFTPRVALETDTHVGLHIMRERAERIGAKLAVQSIPGSGTEVQITLSTAS